MTRPNRHQNRRAFTLVELLVVIAIIGVLVALLLPAVQAAREAARRTQCLNHVKQLSLGSLSYESANGELPFARKFDIWDAYTWTQSILPQIEQQAIYQLYWTLPERNFRNNSPDDQNFGPHGNDARRRQARHTPISMFYCPSDNTPQPNELYSLTWGFLRGTYRGCVGAGDMYGGGITATERQQMEAGAWKGAMGATRMPMPPKKLSPAVRLKEISDGTSRSLLFSEGRVPITPDWGGAIGETIYGNMGGSLFSAYRTPNSTVADQIAGICPWQVGDQDYPKEWCTGLNGATPVHPGYASNSGDRVYSSARSLHAGGVNASMVDGSGRFVTDSIEEAVWRAAGTMANAEELSLP